MRIFPAIALAVVLAPTSVAAQITTFDGVQALLRGDYEAAARILKPHAEGPSPPDPIAQFFLALLYDSGRGVARDQLHACTSMQAPHQPRARLRRTRSRLYAR